MAWLLIFLASVWPLGSRFLQLNKAFCWDPRSTLSLYTACPLVWCCHRNMTLSRSTLLTFSRAMMESYTFPRKCSSLESGCLSALQDRPDLERKVIYCRPILFLLQSYGNRILHVWMFFPHPFLYLFVNGGVNAFRYNMVLEWIQVSFV